MITPHYRDYDPSDLDTVVKLIFEFGAESGLHNQFCQIKEEIFAVIHLAYSNENHFFRVAEINGKVIGLFIGHLENPIFSRNLIATDDLLFVKKEFRKGLIGMSLLHQFEKWAEDEWVDSILLTISGGNKVISACKSLGYEDAGQVLMRNL